MSFGIGPYTPATVLCCNCSKPIDGTSGIVMCPDCIRLTYKVANDIPREATIQFCRNCERFLMPPSTWVAVQPESRELLALLLKRLPGLNKRIRLVDASFLWTEPHSRRIKIKLAVQGEVEGGIIIQETFEVEFVVVNTQCPDCAKSFTVHTWRACVQLRQKVPHKRTFLYIEQLMLRHNAHQDTVTISESRDGIDFFFAQPQHALRLIDFLSQVAPIRHQRSEELISQDTQSGKKSYKFSYSVEIAPICRDDLVVLPRPIAQKLGQINQVVLCSRITNSIQFIDVNTLQKADLASPIYWREPFKCLASSDQLVEFVVLDSEPLGPISGKLVLSDITVALSATMNETYVVRSHLGGILHPGDTAMGYYLVNSNYNSDAWDELPAGAHPDVVLVKKAYHRTSKRGVRNWKLKRLAKEHNEQMDEATIDKVEHDYEVFLQQLEEDTELRQAVNLYKNNNAAGAGYDDNMDGDDGPTIDVSELLEDMEELRID